MSWDTAVAAPEWDRLSTSCDRTAMIQETLCDQLLPASGTPSHTPCPLLTTLQPNEQPLYSSGLPSLFPQVAPFGILVLS